VPIIDYRTLHDWQDHPTQKPVRLMRYLIERHTKEGDLVIDPFAGTGSTALACKQLKRRYLAIEKEPQYAQMAERRLADRPAVPQAIATDMDTAVSDEPPRKGTKRR
jgi:DNA modification methylase